MGLSFYNSFRVVCSLSHGDKGRNFRHNWRLLISWLMIAIASPNKKSKLKHIYLLIGVAVVVIGFMFIKTTSFVKNSPVLNRFATISLTENTTESRLTIWKMSWDGFKEKAIVWLGAREF